MLTVTPINFDEANAFVAQHHRHHKPMPGCKFCIAVSDAEGKVRGVAMIGRPVARGYRKLITYTLPEEGGASLRAAGFKLDKSDAGGSAAMWHNRDGRTVEPVGNDLIGGKWRWAA